MEVEDKRIFHWQVVEEARRPSCPHSKVVFVAAQPLVMRPAIYQPLLTIGHQHGLPLPAGVIQRKQVHNQEVVDPGLTIPKRELSYSGKLV